MSGLCTNHFAGRISTVQKNNNNRNMFHKRAQRDVQDSLQLPNGREQLDGARCGCQPLNTRCAPCPSKASTSLQLCACRDRHPPLYGNRECLQRGVHHPAARGWGHLALRNAGGRPQQWRRGRAPATGTIGGTSPSGCSCEGQARSLCSIIDCSLKEPRPAQHKPRVNLRRRSHSIRPRN